MKMFVEKKNCSGCGACVDACQSGAVSMVRDAEGFWYPKINRKKCTDCGRCGQVCPLKRQERTIDNNLYYGVQAKEEAVRYSSSSGGIFSILAQYVFGKQGSVYGAGYHGRMKVVHKEVRNMRQLEEIKRTKYVQSDMTGVYRKIEGQLKEGRWVLFCGTPCQAHALRLFLNRSYSNLIVVDLVCYGVPSPGIWQSYVNYLERRHNGQMTDFSFRDKRKADNGHTCSYVIDRVEYSYSLYIDPYCKMYFTNYILRPSCYNCHYCMVERESDFTIGDFWGIEKIKPEIDDGMGTSIVMLHTDQAKDIWNDIQSELNWFTCTKEEILQPRLISPTIAAEKRGELMRWYRILPFSSFIKFIFDEKGLKQKWRS